MKKCTACKQLKESSEFNANKARKDGLQTSCRECARDYARGYYEGHKIEMRRQIHVATRQRKKDNHTRVQEWKGAQGCSRCPERTPIALDFHHSDDNKEF